MERSETPSKSCKQMRRKRFTVRKLELKKKTTDFFSYIFKYEKIQFICKPGAIMVGDRKREIWPCPYDMGQNFYF